MMYRLGELVLLNVSAPHKQTLPGALGGDVVVTYETSLFNVDIDIMDGGGNAIYSDDLATLDARADAYVWQHLPGHFQIGLTPAFFTAMSAADGGFGVTLSKSGASGWHMTGAAFFRGGAYEALAVALAAVKTETDKLGAPAGASHAADVAAVKVDTAAIRAKTDNLPSDTATTLGLLASSSDLAVIDDKIDAIKAKTDNLPSNTATILGTPSVSVSADIAAVKTDTGAIKFKTDNLPADTATVLTGLNSAIGSAQDVAGTAATWAEQAQIAAAAVKVKTDNLPADTAATLGTLATSSDLATVDTVVDAIKAKTDNLPADTATVLGSPAGASLAADVAAVLTAVGDVDTAVEALGDAVVETIIETGIAVSAIKAKTDNLPDDTADILGSLATTADVDSVGEAVAGVAAAIPEEMGATLDRIEQDVGFASAGVRFGRRINAVQNRMELYEGETLRGYYPLLDADGNPTSSKTAVVDQGELVVVE